MYILSHLLFVDADGDDDDEAPDDGAGGLLLSKERKNCLTAI